jgi:hypothetical protein
MGWSIDKDQIYAPELMYALRKTIDDSCMFCQ